MEKANYLFGHDYRASARLDLQHFLTKQQIGHLLHPKTVLPETSARIADVGAGTCIWSIETLQSMHPTTRFDCFDITSAQYPPQQWLPENMSLFVHNAFEPFPVEFHGQYDLVNIRFFVCVVKDDDPSTLIKNLVSLLKPGGFIQWVEIDTDSIQVISPKDPSNPLEATQELHKFLTLPRKSFSYNWISTLDKHFEQGGLTAVEVKRYPTSRHFESYHTIVKLLTCEEAMSSMPETADHESRKLRSQLEGAYHDMRMYGAGVTSGYVYVLGRKPFAEETV